MCRLSLENMAAANPDLYERPNIHLAGWRRLVIFHCCGVWGVLPDEVLARTDGTVDDLDALHADGYTVRRAVERITR